IVEQRLAAVSAERDEYKRLADIHGRRMLQGIFERDALRQQLAALEQAQSWEPVPDGTHSADKLFVHVLADRYVIATKATHDDTGKDYWNSTSLPNDYRL